MASISPWVDEDGEEMPLAGQAASSSSTPNEDDEPLLIVDPAELLSSRQDVDYFVSEDSLGPRPAGSVESKQSQQKEKQPVPQSQQKAKRQRPSEAAFEAKRLAQMKPNFALRKPDESRTRTGPNGEIYFMGWKVLVTYLPKGSSPEEDESISKQFQELLSSKCGDVINFQLITTEQSSPTNSALAMFGSYYAFNIAISELDNDLFLGNVLSVVPISARAGIFANEPFTHKDKAQARSGNPFPSSHFAPEYLSIERIPLTTTKKQLKRVFSRVGNIYKIELMSESGKFTGNARIMYENGTQASQMGRSCFSASDFGLDATAPLPKAAWAIASKPKKENKDQFSSKRQKTSEEEAKESSVQSAMSLQFSWVKRK